MNKITMDKMKQNGQIAVVLLLFMLVALTIGLAVTQRSLTSVTTSSQTEQSSRAFSAAEAGIEQAKSEGVTSVSTPITPLLFTNQSQADANAKTQLPKFSGQALEYPPIGKDTIAQFWLANPLNQNGTWNVNQNNFNQPDFVYSGDSFNIYFGNNPQDTVRPAIEVDLIYRDSGGNYNAGRHYYDGTTNTADARLAQNGFETATSCNVSPINTSLSVNTPTSPSPNDRPFLCRVNFTKPANSLPIMLRIRVLYSDIKQPIAVEPVASSCAVGFNCSLPAQAAIYTSTGSSGSSQKTLQVFRETNFMPTFLDFAIFSSGQINKF